MRAPWTRSLLPQSPQARAAPVRQTTTRFDASQAVAISGPDELMALEPAFLKSLSSEFNVEALAGRLCPVLLGDHSVAIFSLGEHVGSDQADELARCVGQSGYALADPQRYVLAAPLLLAIARNQVTAQSLTNQSGRYREQSKTALADAFQDLIEWGVRHGASDLHLNVRLREPESEVKATLAGRYVAPERFQRMPTTTLIDMLSVAWMDIQGGNGAVFDPSSEQQGQMIRLVDGKTVLLRWASLAADQGPSVCLRLLRYDAAASYPSLEKLGYLPDQVSVIERAMLAEGGAIVFAGTVGSGKSTTLASLIAGLADSRKVITIEEPVEYLIPRAIQNTVTRDLDATAHNVYAAKLRALKRSAMNDVLLGEIRDTETGRAFMDLAGSGINVYTTTHAGSAALICERLASDFIGVSRDFLATRNILKLLVHQSLLPKLCQQCALKATHLLKGAGGADGRYHAGGHWRMWLNRIQRLYDCDIELLRIRNPQGCSACHVTQAPSLSGYAGRTVVAEHIEPALTPGFLESIHDADGSVRVTRTAMQCAMVKAMRGQIDPREIELRFQPFETQELLHDMRRDSACGASA
jgi:type II secretory ATPase GspE/PulE/Tfp pilus assembly ATPase PilB-like protein